jgi:hypothetical protein
MMQPDAYCVQAYELRRMISATEEGSDGLMAYKTPVVVADGYVNVNSKLPRKPTVDQANWPDAQKLLKAMIDVRALATGIQTAYLGPSAPDHTLVAASQSRKSRPVRGGLALT